MKPIIFRFKDEATLPTREDYYEASYIVSYGRIQNNPNEQCNLLTWYVQKEEHVALSKILLKTQNQ